MKCVCVCVCSGCTLRCISVYQCGITQHTATTHTHTHTHTSYYVILYSAENHMLYLNIQCS